MDDELEDFAQFEEDLCRFEEGLSPIEAILLYARSNAISQKLTYVKSIGAASLHASESELQSLIELSIEILKHGLAHSSDDDTDIKSIFLPLLKEVTALGKAWPKSQSEPEAFILMQEELIHVLSEAFVRAAKYEEEREVEVDAILDALQSILSIVAGREEKALSIIQTCIGLVPIGHCSTSFKMIAHLSPLFSSPDRSGGESDPCAQKVVMPLIEQCLAQTDYTIQEALAFSLPSLIPLFSCYLVTKSVPRVALSLGSNPNWKVRAALCRSLPLLIHQMIATAARQPTAHHSEIKSCIDVLVDLLGVLASDNSQWVSSAAHCSAGPALIASSSADLVVSPERKSTLVLLYKISITALPRPPPAEDMVKLAACLAGMATICHPNPDLWGGLSLSDVFGSLISSQVPLVAATASAQVPPLLSLNSELLPILLDPLLTAVKLSPSGEPPPHLDELAVSVSSVLLPIARASSQSSNSEQILGLLQTLIDISGHEVISLSSSGGRVEKCGRWRIRLEIARQANGIIDCLDPFLNGKGQETLRQMIKSLAKDPVWKVRNELNLDHDS